jgi:hypothetical protein
MSSIQELSELLRKLPDSPIASELRTKVIHLLGTCWDQFSGTAATKMEWWKVERENGPRDLKWQNPVLSFWIARHGSLVNGSSRAEKQQWSLNIEKLTAEAMTIGHTQVYPVAAPFRTEKMAAIADNVCVAVQEGPDSLSDCKKQEILIWVGNDQVEVKHGVLVPDAGYQQTTAGRRKRFRAILESKMQAIGWKLDHVGRRMVFSRLS